MVARGKSDQFGTAGGRKTAGIPLKNTKIVRGVDFLECGVARYGPTVNLWAVVMRQEG